LIRNGVPSFHDHERHYSECASFEVVKRFFAWAKSNALGGSTH